MSSTHKSFPSDLTVVSLHACSADGRHGVTYEVLSRGLTDTSRHASPAVVAQMGQLLKAALAYTYSLDRLDNPTYPSQGWSFRCGHPQPLYACMSAAVCSPAAHDSGMVAPAEQTLCMRIQHA